MIEYNYFKNYQQNLTKALEVETLEECKALIKPLAELKDVYKKKVEGEFYVKVGKITTKNEILFDIPDSDNFRFLTERNSKYSGVYLAGWFINEQKWYYIPHEDIANRSQFQQIGYTPNDSCDTNVVGFMLGNWRNAEIVLYDQFM